MGTYSDCSIGRGLRGTNCEEDVSVVSGCSTGALRKYVPTT